MKIKQTMPWQRVLCVLALALAVNSAHAQRQMEPLGRGVVALHSATSQAYIGWRLLATDSADIGFKVQRSTSGGAWTTLTAVALTNTTDYLDTSANFTLSNAWRVVPVIGGVDQTPSAASGLAAGSPVRQYLSLPLQVPATGAYPPYDVKFCWVGDFDGDGEYDYLVDRMSDSATAGPKMQFLQAYLRDGTLLWEMNMGPLSTNTSNAYEPDAAAISVGDKDNVTVYDLDGDGKAEVIVRTASGTTNYTAAGGFTNYTAGGFVVTTNNNTSQFLCVVDGMTGAERARALIPNLYFADGPLNCHAGIIYWDGVHPSILFDGENRVGSGNFQRQSVTWDFRNGQLTQRWVRGDVPGENQSEGHQLRIADANHDGKDDLVQIASVVTDNITNGVLVYDTELVHGDRYHISDLDPERPGLEMYAIQQNNGTLLATSLQDMGSGTLFKKWYSGGVADVGRGITLDLNSSYRGSESYSTQPGIFDAKGNQIYVNNVWAPEAIWWDADLLREFEDGAGSGALNPVINKFNPVTGVTDRIFSIYSDDGDYSTHQAYGGRAAFWGDLFGDWREEVVLVQSDYAALRIYTTKIAAANRFYCLMQNPMYRVQATYKGYYQASYLDYYLGFDMPAVPIPPVSNAELVWRGGGANIWDTSTTANWLTNNLWISNTVTVPFAAGQTVLFDTSGSNNTAIALDGSLTPGDVRIWSPKPYTFDGPGELTGAMALTKAGAGKVVFSGTNTYTGKTLIGEGPFVVNGSLPNSPVTVRGGVWLDGRLGGTGIVGSTVRIEEGGGVSPGQGTNSHGTLTLSSNLTLAGRTLSDFDLSDNPGGPTNDLLVVSGNLTLQGTNTLVIRKLNSTLPAGVYPLINYSGTLSGSLANLAVSGLPGVPLGLTNPPGQIALVIKSYRAPANITWTGGAGGNAWDLLNTTNWLNGAAKDQFVPGDTVRFDSVGNSNLTANLSGDLNCAGLIVDSTANYTLAGAGAIIGNASLTKSNTGTLTISTVNNAFTGKTTIAGGTLVVSELDAIGYPSPIGNPPGGSTNLVLSGNSTLRVTGESYTDRGMTLNTGTNTLDVFNAADQLTMAGFITGSGALRKAGAGVLALNVNNTYTGQTLIHGGTVSLGGGTANQYGMGPGPGGNGNTTVTISNATLRMYSDSGSYDNTYWNLIVPSNGTATIFADDRCYLHGTLTGGGTLNLNVYYVRTELDGNWSAFTGVINAGTDSGGGDFRIGTNYSTGITYGYSNATVNLADYIYAYHIVSGAAVSLGAVSGGSLATMSGTAWTVGAKNTNTTYAGKISGNSITKVGTGTWTLTGSNYYTGTTTISGGTLMVNGDNHSASGNVTVGNTATLAGTGLIGGATTVQSGGKLSPGNNAIGTLTFNGNLTFNSGSTAFIEINRTAGTKDLADAGGTLAYGGTLQVTNLSGTLTNGDSFKIFDAASYSGAFAAFNLPVLPGSLTWDTSTLGANGTITVTNGAPAGPQILTWKGDGAGNNWNIAGTANWLNPSNVASFFAQGDAVTFNDTGSNNTPVIIAANVQPASVAVNATKDYIFAGTGSITGTNSLVKSGVGALTLANANTYTGPTIVNAGTLNILGIANRWSFNGSLADLVGTNTATVVDVGANNTTLTSSNIILTGGARASSDYVQLGTNLLPNTATPVTIELWATQNTIHNWGRIFDIGSTNYENLMMSWTVGTGLASDRVEWIDSVQTNTLDNSNQPYTTNVEFHIAMVIEPGAGTGGTTRVTWYRAASTNAALGAARGTFNSANTLANFNDPDFWLGRSHWTGDNTANASYNEVRIWNRSLSAVELQTLHAAGPDANLAVQGMGVLPQSAAVNLAGATAKLDVLSGTRQVIGSLAGVAGSELKLTTASLIVGGDNTSTTFGGVISGSNWLHKAGTGTLTLTGNSTFTGLLMLTNGAIMVNGDNSAATGPVSVQNGALLGGNGIIGGSVGIASNCMLSPGVGIGTLTFSNALSFGGCTTLMEISHTPLTNDMVNRGGSLFYGGTLVVSNISGTLAAGDKFKLFNATSYSGSFASNSFPALPAGLVWNTTKLNVSGTLWVVSTNPPTLSPPTSGGGNFNFGGTGGTPGWDYYVITTTNVTLPPAAWTRVTTNQFDLSGNCAVSLPINPSQPLLFYRVQVP